MNLKQVLYASRAAASVTEFDVRNVLSVSRRNNRRADVTGCLLYSGRHFIQVLEGDAEVLDRLVARIANDPRHDGVQVVVDQTVTARRFPDWSMGILFKLDTADRIEALLGGGTLLHAAALELMMDVNPDSVIGTL
jgi:hypothetical protein